MLVVKELALETSGIARSKKQASMQHGNNVVAVISSGIIFMTNAIVVAHKSTRSNGALAYLTNGESFCLKSDINPNEIAANNPAYTSGLMGLMLELGIPCIFMLNVKSASKSPMAGRGETGFWVLGETSMFSATSAPLLAASRACSSMFSFCRERITVAEANASATAPNKRPTFWKKWAMMSAMSIARKTRIVFLGREF